MNQIPQAAIDALRVLIGEHLCLAYHWDGVKLLEDIDIDDVSLVEFVYAAVEYVLDAYPRNDTSQGTTSARVSRDPSNNDLFTILLCLEPKTLDTFVTAIAHELKLEVISVSTSRVWSVARVYKHKPDPWPEVLGSCVGERELTVWDDHTFGVLAEPDWHQDTEQRKRVFAEIDPVYKQLTWVEIDRESANQLAAVLLAGSDNKTTFKHFVKQANAWVNVLGASSRCFANRDLNADELRDPFAHGDSVDLGTSDTCAGASLLALLVVDGWRVVRLEALWDRWTEC
jgi:hypothetical protein